MAKFCKGHRPVLIRACRPAKKNQKKTCDTLLNYYPNLNKKNVGCMVEPDEENISSCENDTSV